jgi:tripartite ATP-independent transporter DctM subunit
MRSVLNGLSGAIQAITGILGAILVAVEVVLLLVGVIARYVFAYPIVWSDELASILFLWLAMLGAVLAYCRFEHMRMSTVVDAIKGPWRQRLGAATIAVCLVFVASLILPSIEAAEDESFITTPALAISNAWRAAAVPVGLSLMAIVIAINLVKGFATRDGFIGPLVVACLAAALYILAPGLNAIGNYNLVVFFVLIVASAVLSGVPIAFAFGIATVSYLSLTTTTPLSVVVSRMEEGMTHMILLAVPLFVLLGALIEVTGMARTMVAFLASLVGHVRGGLQFVLIGTMYLVSSISGSKAADMAAVAPVLFPEMKARGADQGELLALLCATGIQTETIPPSMVLITIGSVTGVSIAALFQGGLLPGLVLGIVLCVFTYYRVRSANITTPPRASARTIFTTFLAGAPALGLPFVIRFSVMDGLATATEVATIGIAYSLIYGIAATLVFRQSIPWHKLWPSLVYTASLSGAILMIIGAATAMGWALTQSGFSEQLVHQMSHLPGGAVTFMAISIVAFAVLGSVLEGIPAIVLFGPLLFPVAKAVGVHEVHYAMVVVLAMGLGLHTPPFGIGYYAGCAVSGVSPTEGLRPILGYLLILAVGICFIAAVPWISIGFLPTVGVQ